MTKLKAKQDTTGLTGGPILTVRFVIALVLMVVGIAWIVYYYIVVRVDPGQLPAPEPGSPAFMADLGGWNYLIGFGLFFLGLAASAHPSTPLGRGRGVVVGMLGCFLSACCGSAPSTSSATTLRGPGDQRPRAVQPHRRHRLHGRRLHLRHALGVTTPPPSVWAPRFWPGHLLVRGAGRRRRLARGLAVGRLGGATRGRGARPDPRRPGARWPT